MIQINRQYEPAVQGKHLEQIPDASDLLKQVDRITELTAHSVALKYGAEFTSVYEQIQSVIQKIVRTGDPKWLVALDRLRDCDAMREISNFDNLIKCKTDLIAAYVKLGEPLRALLLVRTLLSHKDPSSIYPIIAWPIRTGRGLPLSEGPTSPSVSMRSTIRAARL